MNNKDQSKNSSWHGGKGSKIRTTSSLKKYSEGWDKIFGKNKDNSSNKRKDHER